jgi:DNA polymerase-3 subunit delta
MKLPTSQLAQHLSKGLAPLYVLVGDEPLGQMECLDAIRQSARQNGVEERTALTTDRYFDWSKIAAFGQAMSLFASLRLLEINIPNGKPGIEGSKALQALVDTPLSETITVVILPTIDWRDAKSAWYTALEQKSVLIQLQDVDATKLPQWIAGRLASQQQSTDADTLSFMANQVEGNLLAAHQEIQKLSLLHPASSDAPKELSFEQIEAAVLNVAFTSNAPPLTSVAPL